MSTIKGDCACGKIKIEVPKTDGSGLCHCTVCRKTGGGPASANLVIPRDQVKLTGPEPKMFHSDADSGADVQRYYCGECGSPIYANSDNSPPISFVRAGLFDPGDIPAPILHMYCKNLESWEMPTKGAQQHQGEPPH